MLISTDPLSLVFIGCFLFGLIFLFGTALLGNLGHGGGHIIGHTHVMPGSHLHVAAHTPHIGHGSHGSHGGQGIFSYITPLTIVLFLFGFGFFGYVFHTVTLLALPFVLAFAIVGGFIIAALLLMMVNRIFGNSEASTIQDVSDRTGLLGKVSITIPENGLGEILYVSPGGLRKSIPARSIDGRKIERDQEVVVVNYQMASRILTPGNISPAKKTTILLEPLPLMISPLYATSIKLKRVYIKNTKCVMKHKRSDTYGRSPISSNRCGWSRYCLFFDPDHRWQPLT